MDVVDKSISENILKECANMFHRLRMWTDVNLETGNPLGAFYMTKNINTSKCEMLSSIPIWENFISAAQWRLKVHTGHCISYTYNDQTLFDRFPGTTPISHCFDFSTCTFIFRIRNIFSVRPLWKVCRGKPYLISSFPYWTDCRRWMWETISKEHWKSK